MPGIKGMKKYPTAIRIEVKKKFEEKEFYH